MELNSTNNIILAYDLTKIPEEIIDGIKCYHADILYISKKSTDSYIKYEIESIDFDNNNNMFILAKAYPINGSNHSYLFKVNEEDLQ